MSPLHCNRYSVPISWIGRRVEVRESKDKVEVQLDARNLVSHRRIAEAEHQRVMLPQHRAPWGQGARRSDLNIEQEAILKAVPEIADYVTALTKHSRKLVVLVLRQLCASCGSIPGNRCWPRCAKLPVTVSTTSTGSSA